MKVRRGHVTNSSSVSYLLGVPEDFRLHRALGLFEILDTLLTQPDDSEVTCYAATITEVTDKELRDGDGTCHWSREYGKIEKFVRLFNDGHKLYYVSIPYHPYREEHETLKDQFLRFLAKLPDGVEICTDHDF